jgi:hypothetical protein
MRNVEAWIMQCQEDKMVHSKVLHEGIQYPVWSRVISVSLCCRLPFPILLSSAYPAAVLIYVLTIGEISPRAVLIRIYLSLKAVVTRASSLQETIVPTTHKVVNLGGVQKNTDGRVVAAAARHRVRFQKKARVSSKRCSSDVLLK